VAKNVGAQWRGIGLDRDCEVSRGRRHLKHDLVRSEGVVAGSGSGIGLPPTGRLCSGICKVALKVYHFLPPIPPFLNLFALGKAMVAKLSASG
jgi:hypothetical protein